MAPTYATDLLKPVQGTFLKVQLQIMYDLVHEQICQLDQAVRRGDMTYDEARKEGNYHELHDLRDYLAELFGPDR